MKLIVIDKNNRARLNKFVELVMYILGYTLAFLVVQFFFGSIVVSNDYNRILVSLLAVTIIYFINKTIKPTLVRFAIPITVLTLGLFYFVINTLILKFVDILLGSMLNFTNIWKLFFIAISLSFINILIENIIIKPIMRRIKSE